MNSSLAELHDLEQSTTAIEFNNILSLFKTIITDVNSLHQQYQTSFDALNASISSTKNELMEFFNTKYNEMLSDIKPKENNSQPIQQTNQLPQQQEIIKNEDVSSEQTLTEDTLTETKKKIEAFQTIFDREITYLRAKANFADAGLIKLNSKISTLSSHVTSLVKPAFQTKENAIMYLVQNDVDDDLRLLVMGHFDISTDFLEKIYELEFLKGLALAEKVNELSFFEFKYVVAYAMNKDLERGLIRIMQRGMIEDETMSHHLVDHCNKDILKEEQEDNTQKVDLKQLNLSKFTKDLQDMVGCKEYSVIINHGEEMNGRMLWSRIKDCKNVMFLTEFGTVVVGSFHSVLPKKKYDKVKDSKHSVFFINKTDETLVELKKNYKDVILMCGESVSSGSMLFSVYGLMSIYTGSNSSFIANFVQLSSSYGGVDDKIKHMLHDFAYPKKQTVTRLTILTWS